MIAALEKLHLHQQQQKQQRVVVVGTVGTNTTTTAGGANLVANEANVCWSWKNQEAYWDSVPVDSDCVLLMPDPVPMRGGLIHHCKPKSKSKSKSKRVANDAVVEEREEREERERDGEVAKAAANAKF